MSITNFPSIKNFFAYRDNCIFCQLPLRKALTNFESNSYQWHQIDAIAYHNQISFNITNFTPTYSVISNGAIDIENNILTFDRDFNYALDAFSKIKPNIQMYCVNKSCHFKYVIHSDILLFNNLPFVYYGNTVAQSFQVKISNIKLWMETFVMDDHWIQTDWLNNFTRIYSRQFPDNSPIQTDLMDFKEFEPDRLCSKVKTLISFS